jgi:hypothetical protein
MTNIQHPIFKKTVALVGKCLAEGMVQVFHAIASSSAASANSGKRSFPEISRGRRVSRREVRVWTS